MIDRFFKTVLDVTGKQGALVLLVAGFLGWGVGILFPKYEASAFLQLPQPKGRSVEVKEKGRAEPLELKGVGFGEFKRVWSSYGTSSAFIEFRDALQKSEQSAADVVLRQGKSDLFWGAVATPVLPLSKQDAKEFGELKDESGVSLLGVSLKIRDRERERAAQSVILLGRYLTDALVRERIRGLVVQGDMASVRKTELMVSEIKLLQEQKLMEQRISDLRALVKRFPGKASDGGHQVVSVSDGGELFLPAETQLVAAESELSASRIKLAQIQRQLLRAEASAVLFSAAKKVLAENGLDSNSILLKLESIAAAPAAEDTKHEPLYEAHLQVLAELRLLRVFVDSVNSGGNVQTQEVPSRTPAYMAMIGLMIGLGALVGRKALRMAMSEVPGSRA